MTAFAFLGNTLLQYAVICAAFVAVCDVCQRLFRLDDLLAFCAAVLGLGVLGYVLFWIALANYAVFGVVKIAVLAALLVHCGVLVYRRRLRAYRWLAEPLIFVTLFALVIVTLGFADGGFDFPGRAAQNRFSHPLPVDNLIPYLVAVALKIGHIASPLFGDWLMSDRPPLQTGLYLLLTLRNSELTYVVVAVWLQATFLFGVWGLTVAARVPDAARRVILLACCVLPTSIINTFFTWPKLLSVGYLLLVFALLFCRGPENDRERGAFGVLIGALTALAVLSHGSSLFALLGFTLVVLAFWAWPPLKTMMWGAVTAVALYVPWVIYQNVFDPPANRLLKWHFAGIVDVDSRTFGQALRDAYAPVSWNDYIQAKIVNLAPLVGQQPGSILETLRAILTNGAWNPVGTRSSDFFHLLPSLHLYPFALAAALLLLPFLAAEHRPQRDAALRMLVAIIAICIVFVLMIFQPGQTINHQGTYTTQMLITLFAFTVLAQRALWLALAFIALQAVTVSATYAFTLKYDPALWPLTALSIAGTLALVAYGLGPTFRRSG